MQLARIVGVGLLVASLGATAAETGRHGISFGPIAAPKSTDIDCSLSPFGNSAPVIRDLEPIVMVYGPNGNSFQEYDGNQDPPPLPLAYPPAALIQAPLPGLPPLKSVSADLNGDGQDEVVVAYSDGNYVRLAVYERAYAPGATALLIGFWTYVEGVLPNTIDLVAGDFDGSKDKKQELGVSWVVAATGAVHVMILKGNATGGIGPGNNLATGKFLGQVGVTFPHLAVGDFLLAGHDQLLLAGYLQSSGSIEMDIIDLNDGSFPQEFFLPNVGQSATRSAHFHDGLNVAFNTPFFAVDDAPSIAMQGSSPGGGVLDNMIVNGGDVVDTAAAELVVHVMFPEPDSPVSRVLAERMEHFTTTRDVNNNITAVILGDPSLPHSFDSSILLERFDGDPSFSTVGPRFTAVVADVDGVAPKEIVTARAGHDGSGGAFDGLMKWYANKVHVRLVPSFQYENHGTISGAPVVKFINNSRGDIKYYSWSFGDGTFGPDQNPQHAYTAGNGPYTVKLTVTTFDDTQAVYTTGITVNGGTDASPLGQTPPAWTYQIDPVPVFAGDTDNPNGFVYNTLPFGDKTVVKLAVGDMDRDGLPDVVVSVNTDSGSAVDTHVFKRHAAPDPPFVRTSQSQVLSGNTNLEMVLSDFDGDSVSAELNGAAGDCRLVTDVTVRSLTWMPPYFGLIQAGSYKYAEYGQTKSLTTGQETTSESHYDNSITGWAGIETDAKVPIVDIDLADVTVKATFGGSWQSTSGESHGNDVSSTIDEAIEVGTDDGTGGQEGTLYTETNGASCYTYTMVRSTGPVAGSGLRACEVDQASKTKAGAGVLFWNNLITEKNAQTGVITVPIHWVPAQRDWASLALFHPPTAGAATGNVLFSGNVVPFHPEATDGNFDSAAVSDPADRPYLEIDLGHVADILSVRVFPAADPPSKPGAFEPLSFKQAVKDLWGFRLYASPTAFGGTVPPTAASDTTFVQGGISTFVQETSAVYRIWNVWTGDPTSGEPLRARYLRLQNPNNGTRINISEIQVFGDTHTEPQFYPEAVCDDRVGDGRFKAYVWDNLNHAYKTIQVRGDLIWTGGVDTGSTITGVPGCVNDVLDGSSDPDSPKTVGQASIWEGQEIGGASGVLWNLQNDTTKTDSQIHSNESSVHVGAEFEAKVGDEVKFVAGAAYEFDYGLNTTNQNTTTTGTGFGVGGEIAGFTAYPDRIGTTKCDYYPRPYAFEVHEFSNSGFQQDMYVTDYVVRQQPHHNQGAWQHESLWSQCSYWDQIFGPGPDEDVFGFPN